MEVRLGAEVGLKKVPVMGKTEIITKSENTANLPGSDVNNRLETQVERQSGALKPQQVKDAFQVVGNTINIQA
ncbi:MAG: hypothetical protein KDK39_06190 [Leptospiraceae bacterium]|nr:hypothetical protein [Leptospiraceae bacterium]